MRSVPDLPPPSSASAPSPSSSPPPSPPHPPSPSPPSNGALPAPDPSLEPTALAALSDAEILDQVTTWAGRVAAGEARLLAYLGELDHRKAWAAYGILSCAHWVSWRLGLGSKAAHERVRVARALRALPLTRSAHAAGRLSFTQVRAITRSASVEDEHTWVSLARHSTGRQIETLARGVARARRLQQAPSGAENGRQGTRTDIRTTIGYEVDGSLRVTVRLSAEHGAVLLAAIDAARGDLDADAARQPAAPTPGAGAGAGAGTGAGAGAGAGAGDVVASDASGVSSAEDSPTRRADQGEAILHLAGTYLRARARRRPARARRDRAQLTIAIDPLSGWARLADGELLPPGTLGASVSTTDLRALRLEDLTRHDAARTKREPDHQLRDLLSTVDGERCRYPSCSRRRRLHAHHVRQWSDGGRTDLANLVLLCGRHHTLVHRDRYRMELDPLTRALVVRTVDGAAVPHRLPSPWRPAVGLDRPCAIGPSTLPPTAHDRLDLHYAVGVLLQQAA